MDPTATDVEIEAAAGGCTDNFFVLYIIVDRGLPRLHKCSPGSINKHLFDAVLGELLTDP
jgi:hypothetical protein